MPRSVDFSVRQSAAVTRLAGDGTRGVLWRLLTRLEPRHSERRQRGMQEQIVAVLVRLSDVQRKRDGCRWAQKSGVVRGCILLVFRDANEARLNLLKCRGSF